MKKKVLAFLTAVTMVFGTGGVLPDTSIVLGSLIEARADSYGNYEYTVLDDGTIEINKYKSGLGNMISIPSQINGRCVTRIGMSVFKNNDYIRSVVIPNGITSIGSEAFYNCDGLTSITIPDSVMNIDSSAFESCNNLADIIAPKNITSIGNDAFRGTKWLEAQKSEKPLVIVGKVVYDGTECTGNVVIPNGVTTIASNAFCRCDGLTNILIPDSITSIGDYSFLACTNLKSLDIPDSVTSIGYLAFSGCDSITSLIIPNNVTNIDKFAFSNCDNLKTVTLYNDFVSYGEFEKCANLTDVIIGDNTDSIDGSAFEYCKKLNKVVFGKQLKSIGSDAFYGCEGLTSITLPNSVTNIGSSAFHSCLNLSNIVIPDSVNHIGSHAFWNTPWFSDQCQNGFVIVNGILIFVSHRYSDMIIPNNVICIGEEALYDCDGVKSIEILEGTEKIESEAFDNCTELEKAIIPRSVSFISETAFNRCPKLVIYCHANSTAQKYAIDNGFNYELLAETEEISNCSVTLGITSYTYDGTAKKPSVTVKNGSTTLTNGTDYTVSYSSNTNAGTGKVTITGKGNYTGSVTKNFTINAKSISNATVTLSQTSYTYDGNEKKPTVTVKDGTKTLTSGTDFSLAYSNNKNVGTAKVTVTGKGNYSGTASKNFTISEAPKTDISKCTVTLGTTSYTYDGTAKKPSVTVKNGSTTLTNGTDYTVSYSSNTNAGTGKVTMTGTGNYTGSVTKNFTINAKSISNATLTLSQTSYTYDGNEKNPTITVKDGTKTLSSGTDYSVSYSNNINVGTAKVTITGKGNYSGTASKNFTISEAPKTDISKCTVTLGTTSYTYDGTAKKPSVTVKNGSTTLTNGTDYTVSYSNNTNAGTGKVTITGTGKYTGSVTKTFTINAKSISGATVTLSQTSYTYDGNEKKPTVTVKDGSKTLSNGNDYTVSYSNNKNVGTAKVTVTGKGNYSGTKNVNFTIEPKPEAKKSFEWGKDNWNFNNSSYQGYFSSGTYRSQINNKYLNILKNNLTPSEYTTVFNGRWYDDYWYEAWLDEMWGGSCYGMSSTTLLAKKGLLPFSSYKTNASTLHDLDAPTKNSLTSPSDIANVSSLITYYQMLQVKSVIQQQYRSVPNKTNKENITKIINLLDENSTVLVGFKKDGWGGHAILAYDYEYGSFTKNGVTYQGRIKICDPNNSVSDKDDYYIYFNTNTYNWAIPAYKSGDVLSTKGAVFNYIGADINQINEGGYLSNSLKQSSASYIARIDAVAVSQNRSITKVVEQNGSFVNHSSAPGEIIEDYSYFVGGKSEGTIGYNLYDSDASYMVSQDEAVELALSIDYENCYLTGGSKAGKSVIFEKDGYVSVNGESSDYFISMTFDKDYPTDWFTVAISGSNSDNVSLELVDNGWIVSADNLEKVIVNTNNKDVEAATSFSTEYSSAFIYEIDENTIGIAVDTDNNGTYETTLNTEPKATISNAEITTESAEYVFDDKAVEPIVTVKIGDEILKLGEDYTVEYVDNDKIGTAKIVVTGIGKYSGTTSMTFEIIAKVDSMLGDVNNDGKINVTDVSKTAAHVKGIRPLDEKAQKSADVNGDGKINVTDIAKIAAHVKGIKPLN